ncbi:MAG: glycosyltransferase family 4 protein [Patescibacteria group bacterium]
MKIAFIGQKGIPAHQGGIEKHVEELSLRLAKAGFDITVYSRPAYTKNHQTKYQGVKIVNLPSIKTKHLDAITHTFISSLHSLFQDYDVIHYHGVGPALLSFIPRVFKPRAKVIVTFHCIDRQHQKWGAFARLMLGLGEWAACRFPHETIVVSQTLKKYCRYRFDKETSYIPNGVDIKNIKIQEYKNIKNQTLKKYNLTKNNYFLVVSRLIQHKGIHTLIKAYQKISARGGSACGGKKLVIVGDGANTNNYVSRLKELAAGNPDIIFTGQKSGLDLETLFKNAYLFIQPSEAEGLSIALLEAMSFGAPVLISNIEENQEATDGLALEFKNKNVNDLARQLNFAVKHPNQLKKQAALAKRHTGKNHNWDDIVKQTVEIYRQELIGKKELKYSEV